MLSDHFTKCLHQNYGINISVLLKCWKWKCVDQNPNKTLSSWNHNAKPCLTRWLSNPIYTTKKKIVLAWKEQDNSKWKLNKPLTPFQVQKTTNQYTYLPSNFKCQICITCCSSIIVKTWSSELYFRSLW